MLVQQVLLVYWTDFHWKENFNHISHAVYGQAVFSNHCLLQFPLCVHFYHAHFYLFIDSSFARLIRVVGNIAPSVKFIPSNHYYSMTTIFSQIFNFIVGCVAWLFVKLCIVKLMIKIIILWMHVTKSNIMFCQCSWRWHSIVVKKTIWNDPPQELFENQNTRKHTCKL